MMLSDLRKEYFSYLRSYDMTGSKVLIMFLNSLGEELRSVSDEIRQISPQCKKTHLNTPGN